MPDGTLSLCRPTTSISRKTYSSRCDSASLNRTKLPFLIRSVTRKVHPEEFPWLAFFEVDSGRALDLILVWRFETATQDCFPDLPFHVFDGERNVDQVVADGEV